MTELENELLTALKLMLDHFQYFDHQTDYSEEVKEIAQEAIVKAGEVDPNAD